MLGNFFVRLGIIIVAIFVLSNLIVIDIWMLQNSNNSSSTSSLNLGQTVNTLLPSSTEIVPQQSASCPVACITTIQEATASVKTVQPTQSVTSKTITRTVVESSVKEFFVPLGPGTNNTDDWADVAGLQAYVDSSSYSNIKTVTFEVTAHIPTGNQKAYIRLYNKTDKHPVWFSEVSLEGGTTQFLVSSPITLDSGNKLYQVQMKTSLKFDAVLDQSRLHIITN